MGGRSVENVKPTDHQGHIIVGYVVDVLERWITIVHGKYINILYQCTAIAMWSKDSMFVGVATLCYVVGVDNGVSQLPQT